MTSPLGPGTSSSSSCWPLHLPPPSRPKRPRDDSSDEQPPVEPRPSCASSASAAASSSLAASCAAQSDEQQPVEPRPSCASSASAAASSSLAASCAAQNAILALAGHFEREGKVAKARNLYIRLAGQGNCAALSKLAYDSNAGTRTVVRNEVHAFKYSNLLKSQDTTFSYWVGNELENKAILRKIGKTLI